MTVPTVYTSKREQVVPDYAGGFLQFDLGDLPAGDYSLHVVVSAEVASGLSAPEVRGLNGHIDTSPASPLTLRSQTTFPSLSSNGNAFTQMPMLGTLSTTVGVAVILRCEVFPTVNTPDVRIGATLVAVSATQIVTI